MSKNNPLSPSDLWPLIPSEKKPNSIGEVQRKWQRRDETRKRSNYLRDTLNKTWPELCRPEQPLAPIELSREKIDALLEMLRTESGNAYYDVQSMLRAGLRRGAKLGWFVGDIPPALVRVKAPGSPIIPANFFMASRISRLRIKFIDALPRMLLDDPSELGAALLVSAILFGGVLDRGSLRRLATHPIELRHHSPWFWIELEQSNGNQVGQRGGSARRWLLDPLSARLALQWLQKNPDTCLLKSAHDDVKKVDRQIWKLLIPFLEHLDPGLASSPSSQTSSHGSDEPEQNGTTTTVTSFTQFVAGGELALRLHIEPLLINIAACKLESRSLPEHAWLRLITGKKLGPMSLDVSADAIKSLASNLPINNPTENAIQPADQGRVRQYQIMRDFKRLLRDSDTQGVGHKSKLRKNLERFLRESRTIASPIVLHLMDWGLYRLSKAGGGLKASALQRNLASIATALIDFFGEHNVAQIDEAGFLAIYSAVRDSGQTEAEMALRSSLCANFHGWLHALGLAPLINVAAEIGMGLGRDKRVDANLLNINEYRDVLTILQQEGNNGNVYAQPALLATVLGMRLGLRLGEIFNLRRNDLRGDIGDKSTGADLVVRKGKSANARRLLPLSLLIISPVEIKLINAAKAVLPSEGWLLHEPGDSTQSANVDKTINLVVWALRKATGDPSLHFHHLRHSHVSWLYFMLLPSATLLTRLRSTGAERIKIELRREVFWEAEVGYPYPTRKSPHAIATDAGHASPEIGLFSYAHLIDLALYAALIMQLDKLMPQKKLQAVLGVSDTNLRVINLRLKPDHRLDILPLRVLAKLPDAVIKSLEPDFDRYPASEPAPPRSRLQTIAMALTARDDGLPLEQVGQRFSMSAQQIDTWYQRALELAEKIRGERGGRHLALTKGKRKIQPVFRRNLTKTEWSLAEQVFNAMQVAYIKAETKEWLRGWLKRAAKHGMSGHNEYWCDTPEKALDFIAFAQCVGIPKERLFFIYRPRKLEDQVCQDIDLNFWSCSLNVAVEHFAVQLQGASGRTSLNGLVGLQVMAANYLAIPELELNKQQRVDSSKKREGSSGFWTALRFFVVLSDEPLAEYYSTGLV